MDVGINLHKEREGGWQRRKCLLCGRLRIICGKPGAGIINPGPTSTLLFICIESKKDVMLWQPLEDYWLGV